MFFVVYIPKDAYSHVFTTRVVMQSSSRTPMFSFNLHCICPFIALYPWQPLIFSQFAFFKIHKNRSVGYIAFYVWLLPFSQMYLRFIHVAWISSSFSLLSSIPLYCWTIGMVFIHSPVEKPLGCFQLLVIMSKDVI